MSRVFACFCLVLVIVVSGLVIFVVANQQALAQTADASVPDCDAQLTESVYLPMIPSVEGEDNTPTATPECTSTPGGAGSSPTPTSTPTDTDTPVPLPTPVPCPNDGFWQGTTSQGKEISFQVASGPDCQLAGLKIDYTVSCEGVSADGAITNSGTYVIEQMQTSFSILDLQIAGTFSSSTTVTGTWSSNYDNVVVGQCEGEGAWAADFVGPTPVATSTATSTSTNTPIPTPTFTFTNTPTPTFTPTNTSTPTLTPTNTSMPTFTPTNTPTPTDTPVLPQCPDAGFWQGTTSQGNEIIFRVDDTTNCELANLKIAYSLTCDGGIANVTTETSATFAIEQMQTSFNIQDLLIAGEFDSQVSATGTWSRSYVDDNVGQCDGEGTWTANYVRPTPPDCPQAGAWSGTTNQGFDISWNIEAAACEVSSLSIRYRSNCTLGGAVTKTVTFNTNQSIDDNQFDTAFIDPEVIGDFDTTTTASGTWSSSFFDQQLLSTCLGSGTWTATANANR